MIGFLVLTILATLVHSDLVFPKAPFIVPCPALDSACLLQSAQNAVAVLGDGVQALGLLPLDPMFLDVIRSNDGGLELQFTNTTVTGLKNCVIQSAKIDAKNKQHLALRCSVNLSGLYKLGGRLLIFPIKGEGVFGIRIRDIIIKTHTDIETVTAADGKLHWHISKWRHTFDVIGNAHFEFENLFNGNTLLSKPIIKFANDNWHDVMGEIAPSIVKSIVTRVIETVETLYKEVPLEELVI